VRVATVQYAMLDQIAKPPAGFEYVTLMHFYLQRDEIIKQVEGWLTDGISKGAKLNELRALLPKLKAALKKITTPVPPVEEDSDLDSDDDDEFEDDDDM
jgi:hypothetical protein